MFEIVSNTGFQTRPCFQLVFHWVSKPIHLTRIRCSGWVRAAWVINEFEKCYVKPMKDPLGVSPGKGNQGTTRGKEKNLLTLVGIEPTSFGLDLPLLCRLSYELGQRNSLFHHFYITSLSINWHAPSLRGCNPFNQNFRAEVRKFLGVEWILTGPNGLVPFHAHNEFCAHLK